jgi:hypothetical protein
MILLLIFNSLACFGFWNACLFIPKGTVNDDMTYSNKDEKGALWFIEKWAKNKWFYKPLCGCLPCMASLHSILPYWGYMYFTNSINLATLAFYPLYVLALSGFNYIMNNIIE